METKIIVGRLLAIVLAGTLTLLPGAARAQSASGDIRGVVVDPGGLPLPDAVVTVTNIATSQRREITTDEAGRFVAASLAAGPYEVSAALAGFAIRRQEDVTLSAGHTVTLQLELDKARTPDTVTIGTTPPSVDAAQAFAGSTMTAGEMLVLPTRTRDVLDLARTVPGPAGLPAVLDGTDAAGQGVSLETVRDLSVLTAAPPVEYAGPQIAVVTRTGTSRFSGSAFDFVRDDRSQFGGALGGPIVPGRHFFFASYDGVRLGAIDGDASRHALFARTDHLLSQDHRLMLRADDDLRTRVAVSSANAFGPRLLNEIRVQGTEDVGQVADTLTLVHASHVIRAGFDLTTDDVPGSSVSRHAVFVQDQWWLNGSTTIDAGVRYGREPLLGVADVTYNWQPRVGVAWSGADARLAVRGAYRGLRDGLQNATAGVEWEWMPRVSIGLSYLDYRVDGEHVGGFTAEVYRRLAAGVHYRLGYTRGTGDAPNPLLAVLLPRNRLSATFAYNTSLQAERLDGVLEDLLKDWTVSSVYGYQTALGNTLDPRVARDFGINGLLRVTVLWEAFGLIGRETMEMPRRHQVAARVSF